MSDRLPDPADVRPDPADVPSWRMFGIILSFVPYECCYIPDPADVPCRAAGLDLQS